MPAETLNNFLTSLSIMGKGMLGIFVVMALLMTVIYLLTKYVK